MQPLQEIRTAYGCESTRGSHVDGGAYTYMPLSRTRHRLWDKLLSGFIGHYWLVL